ncbi:hypothetical protein F3Y22_tig00111099pilonHSYRG00039 [Hibiscus syriacus]|uniref:Cytochrome P450 n=1 Tax=Hibiscus syriacus TaxID=106335 RepID=A0A6A2Z2E8_HIBSY|nr:hypothetical protein F3Y22_tig00111099pilonHSYRG00039 [Hibiscus syriacus]
MLEIDVLFGADIFHVRLMLILQMGSPYFWDNPHEFFPEIFLEQKECGGIEGWAGFDSSRSPVALYPNEVYHHKLNVLIKPHPAQIHFSYMQVCCYFQLSDFAFLPFGGGPKKCVGDQFALMESTMALAVLFQKFDVELKGSPESVELVTGATIHTKNGLWCKLKKRSKGN